MRKESHSAKSAVSRSGGTPFSGLVCLDPTRATCLLSSYWYKALGLLVTEMASGAVVGTSAANSSSNGSSKIDGTLVAAALGGAKRLGHPPLLAVVVLQIGFSCVPFGFLYFAISFFFFLVHRS